MPAPTLFTSRDGNKNSVAQGFIAGFGTNIKRNAQALSATATSSSALNPPTHVFVFTEVSVALHRAVSRVRKFVTIFRTN